MKIQYLWHSFFKLNFKGVTLLIDPFVNVPAGDSTFQVCMKCPASANNVKKIDLICVSNEQFDHFDKEFVEAIALKEKAVVVGHESVLNELNIPFNLKHPVKVGDKLNIKGLEINIRGVHYPTSFYPISFHFSKGGESLFFAGNSALMDSFSGIDCDVAILPIGGTSTMDVIDAVRATKTMKPKFVIPMHYNSFESISADPTDFKSRIDKSILKTVPVILKPGQSFKTP